VREQRTKETRESRWFHFKLIGPCPHFCYCPTISVSSFPARGFNRRPRSRTCACRTPLLPRNTMLGPHHLPSSSLLCLGLSMVLGHSGSPRVPFPVEGWRRLGGFGFLPCHRGTRGSVFSRYDGLLCNHQLVLAQV